MTTKVLKLCFEFGEREFNPQETIQLLKMYGYKFWSWGANQFRNLGDKVLTFKINGHHHKGYVCISLGWDDTYTVRLVSTQGNIKFEQTGVYMEDLFDVIDINVEKIPEYVD